MKKGFSRHMALRALLLSVAFVFSSGFRIAQSSFGEAMRWDISPDKPALWIEACDELRNLQVENFYLPDSDPLYPYWFDSLDMIESVMNDFNSIPDSFVSLRFANNEFTDPEATPFQPYDHSEAAFTTISLCTGQKNPALAGHASARSNAQLCEDDDFSSQFPGHCSKRYASSCEVVLSESYIKLSAAHFIHALTHEMAHCLGLMHNQATTASVMSYAADRVQTTRLTLDDKMGIVYLYPTDPSRTKATYDFGLSQCSAPQ